MKKTIITLLALASVVMAAEDSMGTFTWSADEGAVPVFNTEGSITLTDISCTVGYKSTNFNTGTFTPGVNMKDGSWTATFTLTNTSSEAFVLESITFDAFIFNSAGSKHGADTVTREVKYTLSGALGGDTIVDYTMLSGANDAQRDVAIERDAVITFNTPVVLESNVGYEFTLKVENGGTNSGSFVGLNGVTFGAIPEPTTATLSLLALAGLAARRRRK
ncbi:MAG: PEP-CTERM sorting domain-containing protein [Akkermansia sp.]|nr:PEP-CTERM sorting domain-containing protein [Akkermansia sp.]